MTGTVPLRLASWPTFRIAPGERFFGMQTEQIVNGQEESRFLSKKYREPWSLG
jgi:hypothetical protein